LGRNEPRHLLHMSYNCICKVSYMVIRLKISLNWGLRFFWNIKTRGCQKKRQPLVFIESIQIMDE